MDRRLCCVLALVLAVSCTAQADICDVLPLYRSDCGYPGISQSDCNNRGCCFDSSIYGTIWCFHPQTSQFPSCAVAPQDRSDCGYPGISKSDCNSRGCCFDSSIVGTTWCFPPRTS